MSTLRIRLAGGRRTNKAPKINIDLQICCRYVPPPAQFPDIKDSLVPFFFSKLFARTNSLSITTTDHYLRLAAPEDEQLQSGKKIILPPPQTPPMSTLKEPLCAGDVHYESYMAMLAGGIKPLALRTSHQQPEACLVDCSRKCCATDGPSEQKITVTPKRKPCPCSKRNSPFQFAL